MKKTKPSEDGLFGIPPLDPENPWFRKTLENDSIWKTRKYYICQTSGMNLWLGLEHLKCIPCLYRECKDQRKHAREAILSFPCEVGNCRCKNCRYYRMCKK